MSDEPDADDLSRQRRKAAAVLRDLAERLERGEADAVEAMNTLEILERLFPFESSALVRRTSRTMAVREGARNWLAVWARARARELEEDG